MNDEFFNDKTDFRKRNFKKASVLWRNTEKPRDQLTEKLTGANNESGNFISTAVFCVVVSVFASLVTVAGYDRWYAQKVVAVDIKGYIAQQRDNYLAGKLNDDELRKSFDRLEAVITAIPKNRVIIMGDAVVRNAETVKP